MAKNHDWGEEFSLNSSQGRTLITGGLPIIPFSDHAQSTIFEEKLARACSQSIRPFEPSIF